MTLDFTNGEGYPDPTMFEACTNILKTKVRNNYRPIVYICSPCSGDLETNLDNARRYSRFAVFQGCVPLAPHLLFPQFMNDADEVERDLCLSMDRILLAHCREIWVFGNKLTEGMKLELRGALIREIPIRHFTSSLEPVPREKSVVFDYLDSLEADIK